MPFSIPVFIHSQLFATIPVPEASHAGQIVIVTGSNVGLGKEAARHVVRLGAEKVIIAVRNVESGKEAAKDIESTTGRTGVCEVWKLDLASFESVKAFAAKAQSLPRLDAVLENAGLATQTFSLSPEAGNHERTIAVNVINTFLLALLLIPKLRETGKQHGVMPRLTIVASDAHQMAAFKEKQYDPLFPALSDKSKSDMMDRYPLSKLLEIMMIRQVAPLMGTDVSTDVVLNCVSPGLCYSQLDREMTFFPKLFMTIMRALLARSTEVGGRTLVNALNAGRKTHGTYQNDCKTWEPDPYVLSAEGEQKAQKTWIELKEILENVQPGITNNLKA